MDFSRTTETRAGGLVANSARPLSLLPKSEAPDARAERFHRLSAGSRCCARRQRAWAKRRCQESTILTLKGDKASGETCCLAHHVTIACTSRNLMIASLRYLDTFAKEDGRWLFSERLL